MSYLLDRAKKVADNATGYILLEECGGGLRIPTAHNSGDRWENSSFILCSRYGQILVHPSGKIEDIGIYGHTQFDRETLQALSNVVRHQIESNRIK